MSLTLRVENFDVLDNAGPISIVLDQRGCEVGRGRAMDWVLPAPSRRVSGQHFSVAFQDGTYLLTDASMNGTYMQGSPHRMQGPHTISHGDRFVVGHYVIVAELTYARPHDQSTTSSVNCDGLCLAKRQRCRALGWSSWVAIQQVRQT